MAVLSITKKQGTTLYHNDIRLDPATMLDANDDPTVDVALAVKATSYTDPATGSEFGGGLFVAKVDHAPIGAEEYAVHVSINNVTDPASPEIDYIYFCGNKPAVALYTETVFDSISSLMEGVGEWVPVQALRDEMNTIVIACGYEGAVVSATPVLTEVSRTLITSDYAVASAESGVDQINLYEIPTTETVTYKLTIDNVNPDGTRIALATRKGKPIKVEFLNSALLVFLGITENVVDPLDKYWQTKHTNVDACRRSVLVDPNKTWTVDDYTESQLIIATTRTENRATSDITQEIIAKATA